MFEFLQSMDLTYGLIILIRRIMIIVFKEFQNYPQLLRTQEIGYYPLRGIGVRQSCHYYLLKSFKIILLLGKILSFIYS
jgi:hypothetical protein